MTHLTEGQLVKDVLRALNLGNSVEALVRGAANHVMLLLDTSILIEFKGELAQRKIGPAHRVLAAHRQRSAAT